MPPGPTGGTSVNPAILKSRSAAMADALRQGHEIEARKLKGRCSALLLELYDLRGVVEHLNVPTDLFSSGTDAERKERVNRRTRQADALARFAMVRILESDLLFETLKTDAIC